MRRTRRYAPRFSARRCVVQTSHDNSSHDECRAHRRHGQCDAGHLGTKAYLADLRSELHTELAEKPSKTYTCGVLGVLITAYAAGLTA